MNSNDNKNLPKIIENSGLALHKKLVVRDAWLDELIAWADENNISDYHYVKRGKYEYSYGFPRNKQQILAMTKLGLHENKLTKFPESIGQLTNLEELHVWNNQLTSLPKSIGQLTNLTTICVTRNPIKSLPPELSHLNSITKFNY